MAEDNTSFPFSTVVTTFCNISQYAICNDSYLSTDSIFKQAYVDVIVSLMTTSTILNSMIIIIICSNKCLHTVSNVFISSLAISDLIVSLSFGITEFAIINARSICTLSALFRIVRVFTINFGVVSNIWNHLIISLERWLYIAHPFLHHRLVTRRLTVCSLIFMWIFSAAWNINMMTTNDNGLSTFRKSINVGIIRPALHFSLSFIMISVYSHIVCLTRRAIRNINKTRPIDVSSNNQGVTKSLASLKLAWKNIRMLVTVFGAYFIFMTPCVCVDIFEYSSTDELHGLVVGKVVDMIWSTHSSINFFIYAVQDRAFRDVFKKCLRKVSQRVCQQCSKSVNVTTESN